MARPRPGYLLRDAALAYASRGIPVLPLYHPVAHWRRDRWIPDGQALVTPERGSTCSCGDRACCQFAKHPLGALAPMASTMPPRIGPGSWPGGLAIPWPTSASPPGIASTSWTSTAPTAPKPSTP